MDKSTLSLNKKTLNDSKVFEVTSDIIVPDIKPDIVSIINTNGNAYIYKVDLNLGKVRFDGNIDMYIVYLAESGENRVLETTLNFAEIIENQNITDNSIVKEKIIVEGIETKVLNERKLSIKANLKLGLDVYEKVNVEIPSEFGEEKENIKFQKETLEIKSIVRNKQS